VARAGQAAHGPCVNTPRPLLHHSTVPLTPPPAHHHHHHHPPTTKVPRALPTVRGQALHHRHSRGVPALPQRARGHDRQAHAGTFCKRKCNMID
jgi:hypothetical protein